MSLLTQASLILTPNAYKANKLYSIIPSSGNGDMTTTRATTATRTNSSGLVENVATGIPRIDHTSGVGSILLEPQRTNSIRNSTMAGAVLNTTTMPTGWQSNSNGLTQTIVGIGTENGLNYIDIRFNGIASTLGNSGIRTTNSTTIVALQNQNWTFSSYVKILAQPLPATFYQLAIYERSNTGDFLQSTTTSFNNTTLNRISHSSTLANASTAYVQSDIIGGITSGQSYDFTLRIAGSQMETGSYATSYIPTTTSTVTRNLDDISRTGISTDILNPSEGTLYVEISVLSNDLTPRIIELSDGTDFNRVAIQFPSISNVIRLDTYGGAVTPGSISNYRSSVTVSDITTFHKCLIKWGAGGLFGYVDGVKYTLTLATNPGTGIPTALNRIDFKQYYGGNPFYGKCKGMQIYKTALSDAECASLTTL